MPQFSLKLLLILCSVIAVWMFTAVLYKGGSDIRHSIVLVIVGASATKLYSSNGRSKCFWIRFVVTLFVASIRQYMLPNLVFLKYAIRPLITSVDIYGSLQRPMP